MREPSGLRAAPSTGLWGKSPQSASFFGRTPACAVPSPSPAPRSSPSSSTARPRSSAWRRPTAEAAAQGRRPRRLPGGLPPGLSLVGLGQVPGRLGRPARQGGVRAPRRGVGRGARARRPTGSGRSRASTASGSSPASPRSTPSGPGTLYNTLLYHDAEGQPRAPPPQARAHEPRAARLGPGRRARAAGDRDRLRPARRAHLLGELHAARALLAVRVRASRSTSRRRRTTRTSGRRRSSTSRGSRARSWSRRATSSGPPPTRRTSRCARPSTGVEIVGRGGSAILGPDGAYLAGPLYDEEGILYAELDPARLHEERQRFDPAGHYHRPDVLRLEVNAPPEA